MLISCIHQVRNNKNSDWVSSSSSELAVNNKKFPINMDFHLSAAVTSLNLDEHFVYFTNYSVAAQPQLLW